MFTILPILFLSVSLHAANLVPNSFSTTFEETTKSLVSGKDKKSYGKIDYKFPGQIRYEVTSPNPTTFVTNGKKSWYYTPPFVEGEQGEVKIMTSSHLPFARFLDSLNGGLEKSKHFTYHYKGNDLILTFNKSSQKDTGLVEVQLHATKDARTVEKIKEFDFITLVRTDKQTVNLKFVEFKEDANFPSGHFEFAIPPKTKIVK
jgi:outer membrane lipoprotein carrier protein